MNLVYHFTQMMTIKSRNDSLSCMSIDSMEMMLVLQKRVHAYKLRIGLVTKTKDLVDVSLTTRFEP